MNSRQALCPCARDTWIQQTKLAVDYCREHHIGLISSVGMSTWELVTSLAIRHHIPLKIYYPLQAKQTIDSAWAAFTGEFNPDPLSVLFHPIAPGSSGHNKKIRQQRDARIISSADILFPVAIRSNGQLDSLLAKYPDKINNQFSTAYSRRSEPLGYTIESTQVSREIKQLGNDYIFHWTKTAITRWPDETLLDYYTAITESDNYPRSAYKTLQHIISSKKLIGSSNHIAGNEPVVAFSNQAPFDMLPLFSWRSRYRQMSFESYGIGIEKETALSIGIKKVYYYDKKSAQPCQPRWLTQSIGTKTDWRKEMEYRHKGDLDLSTIDRSKLLLITRHNKEAAYLHKISGLTTISYTAG